MPRKPRQKSAFSIYHIVIKGADRQLLFEEPKDYRKFLDLVEYYKEECNFNLYAYCLMSNHVHLLLRANEVPLETIFRKLNTTYAIWFNAKYRRTGFLLDGRYHSEPINTFRYFFTVIRYIHKNPYHAGMEKQPGSTYPWSSFFDYQSARSGLTDTEFVLGMCPDKESFFQMHEIPETEKCLDIDSTRRRLPDDVAMERIKELCSISTLSEFQNFSQLTRNSYLLQLTKQGLSIRQLNRLTGVPRGIIERVIKK